jgi:hypothetical protein
MVAIIDSELRSSGQLSPSNRNFNRLATEKDIWIVIAMKLQLANDPEVSLTSLFQNRSKRYPFIFSSGKRSF